MTSQLQMTLNEETSHSIQCGGREGKQEVKQLIGNFLLVVVGLYLKKLIKNGCVHN